MTDTPIDDAAPEDAVPDRRVRTERVRMSGRERREQLVDVGRRLFADKGFEAVTIEEIAAKAGVSKPVVYEHFGSKDGLYAVIVDREMNILLGMVERLAHSGQPACASRAGRPRALRLHRGAQRRVPRAGT